MTTALLEDKAFQNIVLSLLIKDRIFLQDAHHLVSPSDFKNGTSKKAKSVIAKLSLEYYSKYRTPIRDMLLVEVSQYAKARRMPHAEAEDMLALAKKLRKAKPPAVSSVLDRIVDFKKEVVKAEAIRELVDAQSSGQLTDEKWAEINSRVGSVITRERFRKVEYFEGLEDRILRRDSVSDSRFPVSFIEPLDAMVRLVGRKHLGLVIAPYKRGKSLFLMWLALAYTLQGLNVLYFTLEDALDDVEDRFDAAVTKLPIKKLRTMPRKLRQRFKMFKRLLRSRLQIIDATDGGMTIPDAEAEYDKFRDQGFLADAVILDYDDEVKAVKRHAERRMEFAEIYRGMRQFAARRDCIFWTAAQTKKGVSGNKVVTGDDVAEDVSKVRKSTVTLTLGQGDWGEHSLYINVAAHKLDRQNVGVNIMTNFERMLIYDREATLEMMKKQMEGEHEREY